MKDKKLYPFALITLPPLCILALVGEVKKRILHYNTRHKIIIENVSFFNFPVILLFTGFTIHSQDVGVHII